MRSQTLYAAAKYNNDLRAVRSGSPKRIVRRVARRTGWRLGSRLLKSMMR